MVDIIKAKTDNVMARQQTKRQFEEIGERAAQSLIPLFEVDLNENSRTAVALAVSETLNKSPIDSSLLVKRDLDPTELVKFLKNSRQDAARDFSEAETELYNRLLEEISQDVVDIASQLPFFTERTLGEILRRETHLLSATNEVLREIRRIRESSRKMNATDASAARFENEYRRVVVRKFDEMEIFGADLPSVSRRS